MSENEWNSSDFEDTFFLHNYPSKQYVLKFSPTVLSIRLATHHDDGQTVSNNYIELIPIDDIYGCLCMKSYQNAVQCHLTLYLYTLRKSKGIGGTFNKKENLYRSQRVYTYGKFSDFESNLAEMTRWYRAIKHAIYVKRNLPQDLIIKSDQRVLVFINPAGGAGKAQRLVMEHVLGVWSEAEFNFHLIITEYAGHAREYVQAIKVTDWNGIIVASGDGLIYEVINGLMSRNDWQEALKLPIGHLPCGSGNAFITNIIRQSKQPILETMEKFVVQAAVLIATHHIIPFDLATVDICDGQRLFSFLCIEWGIVADVDCDSEQYRFLGETRFTVEAVKRILQPRIYNGYIDYIPYEANDSTRNIMPLTSNTSIHQLHQHLIPLDQPIPIDSPTTKWRRIHGPFAHVLITSKASISKDAIASPTSTLSDGYLTLQFIRSDNSSRMNLAKTFTKLSDGKHFDYDFVQWMPICAFRIVPEDGQGNIMVDGEKVPYGPLQGEILPSIARCMGKQPKTT